MVRCGHAWYEQSGPSRLVFRSEVENEDLVFTLEAIVEKFGEHMAPFAVQMTQQLAAAFMKYANADDEDDDDDVGEAQGRGGMAHPYVRNEGLRCGQNLPAIQSWTFQHHTY